MLQMLIAFKFDYLQLKAGAEPYEPPNPTLEKILLIHCEYASQLDKEIIVTIINFYNFFYEETLDLTEITLARAVAAIQAVVENGVQQTVE